MNACVTDPRALLERLARRTMRFDFTVWFWGDPIAFDGFLDAAELLGEERFAAFAARYLGPWSKAERVDWVDVNCPGFALVKLYERTGEGVLLEGARALARHLMERVPRALDPECPIYEPHRVTHRNYAWVDTLYHLPPFFLRLAAVTGDPGYAEHGVYVVDTHVRALLDPETLLFSQGRDLASEVRRGYGWGRGMGWAILGLVDTLELLEPGTAAHGRIAGLVQRISAVLLGLQHPAGAWRNLVHDRECPLEASTAALIGAAFEKGVRLGMLGSEYEASADRAWAYVARHIDEEGGFFNVSACSWAMATPGDDTDLYKRFYTEVNVWGQGSAMRAAGERIRSGKLG